MSTEAKVYDVLIVGGSSAGWSAALCLGRSLRSVLVLDSNQPCNRFTPHSQNFLTRDGEAPGTIRQIAMDQVLNIYGETVEYQGDVVVTQGKNLTTESGTLFELTTDAGTVFQGKKVVFATGVKDMLATTIEGFEDCWGVSIIHCPYCHGYEHKERPTAVLLHNPEAKQAMKMIPLVKNVVGPNHPLTMLTNGKLPAELGFDATHLEKLEQHNIVVITQPVKKIVHEKGYLSKVHFEQGAEQQHLEISVMYALVKTEQACRVPIDDLGCNVDEMGYVAVDPMQKTSVPGIFACGDNTTFLRQIAKAVSAGNICGAIVNMELAAETW
eukprot:CAMPEP_0168783300 /NCGR_PEP_ID=MMETSP0725-20121227/9613_1 /TAXON_ID=265536 /ORGANISM="Amphiprora sp., Strain CCMP467" /LENGTH=325 /DNA_ID=CAMNT_0008833269 /DNA_START=25 /DNA_END=999 /DNA_ORIENTATION=-